TLRAWREACFSDFTTRATGNAVAILTAGAGERRWGEPSSGGSLAATPASPTRIALWPSGNAHRTRRGRTEPAARLPIDREGGARAPPPRRAATGYKRNLPRARGFWAARLQLLL